MSTVEALPPPAAVYAWRRAVGIGMAYGSAVGLLGLTDIWLPHVSSPEAFGTYQLVRQICPLVVLGGLAGIDQLMSRQYAGQRAHDVAWSTAIRPVALRTAGFGIVAGLVVGWWLGVPTAAVVVLLLVTQAMAVAEVAANYLRAAGQYVWATSMQQAYRLLLAVSSLSVLLVPSLRRNLFALLVPATVIPFVVATAVLARQRRGARTTFVNTERSVGWLFAVAMVVIGALDWVDQGALAARWGVGAAGIYVAMKVPLVFPYVVLASVLGFSALPETAKRMADRPDARVKLFDRRLLGVAAGLGAVLAGALYAAGSEVLAYVPDGPTAAALLVAGACRLLYVLPSAAVGALADRCTFTWYVAGGVGALALEAATIFVAPGTWPTGRIGATGLLVGSVTRLGSATVLARRAVAAAGPQSVP